MESDSARHSIIDRHGVQRERLAKGPLSPTTTEILHQNTLITRQTFVKQARCHNNVTRIRRFYVIFFFPPYITICNDLMENISYGLLKPVLLTHPERST